MTEKWKDVKGFEGIYQVSNLGRVKSLPRRVRVNRGGYWIKERVRKLGKTRGGYLFVPLIVDGKTVARRVNRLVAEAFVDGYDESKEVHHINGDKTDNRAQNLVCLTSKDHRKEHPPKAVIGRKGDDVIILQSCADAKACGFDPANVSRCCKCAELPDGNPRKRKYATHKGYIWRYAE